MKMFSVLFALGGALALSGCSTTPAPVVVDESNVFEITKELEAKGFDIELCMNTLFWELYEQTADEDQKQVFIAESIICAQDGVDMADADVFNSTYQERYDAIE